MKLKIEKLIFEGKGLGRDKNDKPVFIKKSVPEDELEIEITKDKKSYAEGIIKNIITPSNHRIKPNCPHFDQCGGCDHQNIAYDDQLKYKEEIFKETLLRANIESDILPIISGSENEFYYRNVIRFFFSEDNNGKIGFAMHDYADFNKLVPIKSCLLQSKTCNEVLKQIVSVLNNNNKTNIKNWLDSKKILDSLWQLRIREGKATGQFMVEIITKNNELPFKQEIIEILKSFSEIKSIYHTVALNKTRNWQRKLLYGSPIIYEKIGNFSFQISPESFFQTNSLGVKTLYDKIKEFAEIKIGDNILDLYCGTGTIGIYLSTLAKKITGIEIIQNAINDARSNARLNKIPNCEFICADATKWLTQNINQNPNNKKSNTGLVSGSLNLLKQVQNDNVKFNTIILDPPRDGLSKELIQSLYELYDFINFKLIYVSCNPTTFARDIKLFENNGLELKKVQPIDMFPQTHHIECIGIISK